MDEPNDEICRSACRFGWRLLGWSGVMKTGPVEREPLGWGIVGRRKPLAEVRGWVRAAGERRGRLEKSAKMMTMTMIMMRLLLSLLLRGGRRSGWEGDGFHNFHLGSKIGNLRLVLANEGSS